MAQDECNLIKQLSLILFAGVFMIVYVIVYFY